MFKLFHVWCVDASTSWFLYPFDMTPVSLITHLYLMQQEVPGSSSSFPTSHLEVAISRSPLFFLVFWYFSQNLETTIELLGVLHSPSWTLCRIMFILSCFIHIVPVPSGRLQIYASTHSRRDSKGPCLSNPGENIYF